MWFFARVLFHPHLWVREKNPRKLSMKTDKLCIVCILTHFPYSCIKIDFVRYAAAKPSSSHRMRAYNEWHALRKTSISTLFSCILSGEWDVSIKELQISHNYSWLLSIAFWCKWERILLLHLERCRSDCICVIVWACLGLACCAFLCVCVCAAEHRITLL